MAASGNRRSSTYIYVDIDKGLEEARRDANSNLDIVKKKYEYGTNKKYGYDAEKEYEIAHSVSGSDLNTDGTKLIEILKSKLHNLDAQFNELNLEWFEELFQNEDSKHHIFKIRTIQALISLLELKLAISRGDLFYRMFESCVAHSLRLLMSQQETHNKWFPRVGYDGHPLEARALIGAIKATAQVISTPSQGTFENISHAIDDLLQLKIDSRNDKRILGMVGLLCLAGGIAGILFLNPLMGILAGIGVFLLYKANNVSKQEVEHAKRHACFGLFKEGLKLPVEGQGPKEDKYFERRPTTVSYTHLTLPTNREV